MWQVTSCTILRLPCFTQADFKIFEIDKRLKGNIISKHYDTSDVQCTVLCVESRKCRSYNIHVAKIICELNSKALIDNGTKLTDDMGWVYKSTDYTDQNVCPTFAPVVHYTLFHSNLPQFDDLQCLFLLNRIININQITVSSDFRVSYNFTMSRCISGLYLLYYDSLVSPFTQQNIVKLLRFRQITIVGSIFTLYSTIVMTGTTKNDNWYHFLKYFQILFRLALSVRI